MISGKNHEDEVAQWFATSCNILYPFTVNFGPTNMSNAKAMPLFPYDWSH